MHITFINPQDNQEEETEYCLHFRNKKMEASGDEQTYLTPITFKSQSSYWNPFFSQTLLSFNSLG